MPAAKPQVSLTKIAGRVYLNRGASRPPARLGQAPQHKFSVGQRITLPAGIAPRLPRKAQDDANAEFEITRLLPVQGPDLMYRVKNAATSQERVVAESEITPVS